MRLCKVMAASTATALGRFTRKAPLCAPPQSAKYWDQLAHGCLARLR